MPRQCQSCHASFNYVLSEAPIWSAPLAANLSLLTHAVQEVFLWLVGEVPKTALIAKKVQVWTELDSVGHPALLYFQLNWMVIWWHSVIVLGSVPRHILLTDTYIQTYVVWLLYERLQQSLKVCLKPRSLGDALEKQVSFSSSRDIAMQDMLNMSWRCKFANFYAKAYAAKHALNRGTNRGTGTWF